MAWLELGADQQEDHNTENKEIDVDCMILAHLEKIEELLEHMIEVCCSKVEKETAESVIAFHERKK